MEKSIAENPSLNQDLEKINYACADMVEAVEQQTLALVKER